VATKNPRTKRALPAASSDGVETFLAALDHPLKRELLVVRQIILGADPRIAEGIKWNAPSFHTSEYFATFHLRAQDVVRVILHLGAKTRDLATRIEPADPTHMLEWLGKDRASVTFRDMRDIESRRASFADVIREWIAHVPD
jgi:hypothetical protein